MQQRVDLDPVQIVTAPTVEELARRLGGAADHEVTKLRLEMEHHAPLMHALSARWLSAGPLVSGNHDADWYGKCRPNSR